MELRDVAFALAAGGVTFLLTVIWGEPLITLLKRFGIGKKFVWTGRRRI